MFIPVIGNVGGSAWTTWVSISAGLPKLTVDVELWNNQCSNIKNSK